MRAGLREEEDGEEEEGEWEKEGEQRRAKRPPNRLGHPTRQRGLGFNSAEMYVVGCWLTGL